jgi:hypothetical protein
MVSRTCYRTRPQICKKIRTDVPSPEKGLAQTPRQRYFDLALVAVTSSDRHRVPCIRQNCIQRGGLHRVGDRIPVSTRIACQQLSRRHRKGLGELSKCRLR